MISQRFFSIKYKCPDVNVETTLVRIGILKEGIFVILCGIIKALLLIFLGI